MRINAVIYGPVRTIETLPDLVVSNIDRFHDVVIVRYTTERRSIDLENKSVAKYVFVEDPGSYVVEERVGHNEKILIGQSNSKRQFTMIRAGLEALSALPEYEPILLARSDLSVYDPSKFWEFIDRSIAEVTCKNRTTRLTTNSINPLAFPGQRLHGSDWLFVTTLKRARESFNYDPSIFATGIYKWHEWIRKDDFCVGAFSAEQLFNIAAYFDTSSLMRKNYNAVNIPLNLGLRFMRDNIFVSPKNAGVALGKWEYLYSCNLDLAHPYPRGVYGTIRRLLAWLVFWANLAPPTGKAFAIRLIAKATISWAVNLPRLVIKLFTRKISGTK